MKIEMERNDIPIEDILRGKLRQASMETVPHDWMAIERSLGLAPRRRVLPGRLLLAVAGCAAAAVLGGLLVFHDPVLPPPPDRAAAPTAESAVVATFPAAASPVESSAVDVARRLRQAIVETNARRAATATGAPAEGHIGLDPARGGAGDPNAFTGSTSPVSGDPAASERPYTAGNNGTRRFDRIFESFDEVLDRPRRRTRGSNWMLSLFANGASRTDYNRPTVRNVNLFASSAPVQSYIPVGGPETDMSVSNNLLDNTSDPMQEVTLIRSATDVRTAEASWSHQAPLAFGLAARRNLSERWGVELGLTYTYLSSKATLSTDLGRYDTRQQLHYLGVPLSLTYTPLRRGNFELYGKVGGAVDLNIAGKRTETSLLAGQDTPSSPPTVSRFTADSPQWSVAARLGLMYRISPSAGVYVEPGIGYYFENTDQYESYWTNHPTQFNLQVGVRTTF